MIEFGAPILPSSFWDRVTIAESGCWEWQGGRNAKGYGSFSRPKDGTRLANRRMFKLVHSVDLTPEQFICHSCDNPPCVNPSHLWLGDVVSNTADSNQKGRHVRWNGVRQGEGNHNAKLTEADVLEMRSGNGVLAFYAEQFGIGQEAIRRAIVGRTWSHLPPAGADRVKMFTQAGRIKIASDQISLIIANPEHLTNAALARKYGVSHTTISEIRLGKKRAPTEASDDVSAQ